MFAPGLIVWEKRPRWETELKRELGAATQVRPCRLPAEVLTALARMPESLVVIDLAAGTPEGLRLIDRLARVQPRPEVLVIAPVVAADLEWPVRELGAFAFLTDNTPAARVVKLCQRALARVSPAGVSPLGTSGS